MTSPMPRGRKQNDESRHLLSIRSTLIFLLAVLTALGGAGLLLLAHRAAPLVTFSAFGILAAATLFYNQLIELSQVKLAQQYPPCLILG